MTCSFRPSIRSRALGCALAAAAMIGSSSALARAQPASIAPSPPQQGYPILSLPGAASPLRSPDYFYVPGAESSGLPGSPELAPKRRWYGWQTLLIVGASTTVGLAVGVGGGAAARSGTVAVVGMGLGGAGLLFGGPIVHWAHGHVARGFGSLGINLGMPVVGAGLGVAVACAGGGCSGQSNGFAIFFGPLIGGGLGSIAAVIVDVSVLSREPVEERPSTASRATRQWTLVPDLDITPRKTTFGVAGVF
jgi:hypothetical protein